MPIVDNPLATTLAKIGQAGLRPAFEFAFNQMQNTLIRRVNTEIEKVRESNDTEAQSAQLKLKINTYGRDIDGIQRFIFDTQANALKLQGMADDVATLVSHFGSDGDANDVTAEEKEAFIESRDTVVEKLKKLYVLYHEDVNDGIIIEDLLEDARTLETLTPDIGGVDPEGTENPNNNRIISDFLSELSSKVSVGQTVTETALYAASTISLNIQRKLSDAQAALLQNDIVNAEKNVQKIEDIKIEYANLLKVISLSYEFNSYYTDQLSNSLGRTRPEPGSVLNLFT